MILVKNDNSIRAIRDTAIPLLRKYKDAVLAIYIEEEGGEEYIDFEISEEEEIKKKVENSDWEILYMSPDYYDFVDRINWDNIEDDSITEEEVFMNYIEKGIIELIYI